MPTSCEVFWKHWISFPPIHPLWRSLERRTQGRGHTRAVARFLSVSGSSCSTQAIHSTVDQQEVEYYLSNPNIFNDLERPRNRHIKVMLLLEAKCVRPIDYTIVYNNIHECEWGYTTKDYNVHISWPQHYGQHRPAYSAMKCSRVSRFSGSGL